MIISMSKLLDALRLRDAEKLREHFAYFGQGVKSQLTPDDFAHARDVTREVYDEVQQFLDRDDAGMSADAQKAGRRDCDLTTESAS